MSQVLASEASRRSKLVAGRCPPSQETRMIRARVVPHAATRPVYPEPLP